MTNAEALNHLLSLARSGRAAYHPGYDWSVKYARECKAFFADVGINDYILRFARRESPEVFQQSLEITSPVNGSLGSILERPFAKIARSNWTKVVTFPADDDGAKAAAFEKEVLAAFGKKGLFPYIFERLRYWNIYDPNCFVVVEFGGFDKAKQRAKPYPFEVTAEMAVDFQYEQATLNYLCCRQVQDRMDEGVKVQVERLTMYRPEQTVVLQQLTKSEAARVSARNDEPFSANAADGDAVSFDGKTYVAIIPLPHKSKTTPAFRAGYIDNPEDDGKTVLSIFHAALPFSRILLKINREMQNAFALLAFPLSIRHQERCEELGCDSGKLHTGESCATCRGTGFKQRPTTVAEEIVLPMPDRPEDMLDVSRIITYSHPPVEAIRLQVELWDKMRDEGVRAVFNSVSSTKTELAQTATYHRIELDSVYDTLWPYGKHLSQVCAAMGRTIGEFTGFPDATALPVIPTDLRFETVADLFGELSALREAGGGSDAAAVIQGRIMERMLRDDPVALSRWRAEDALNPFRGLSEEQVSEALNSSLVPDDQKIYYVNRATILEQIVGERSNFHQLKPKEQRGLIAAKVEEYKRRIAEAASAMSLGAARDTLGKIPLALQQLALARTRANEDGDLALASKLGAKIDELSDQI